MSLKLGGVLSGPFLGLPKEKQMIAITALLSLPEKIDFLSPRELIPAMVNVQIKYPKLNVLNTEAAATLLKLDAIFLCSAESESGQLRQFLAEESIRFNIQSFD